MNKKMNKKIMLFYKSSIRSFSTSKLSFNNNEALNNYKNEIFLKPILKVENELLAPIVFNEHILKELENLKFIFSKFPNSNLVKQWLITKLEQDKIIINAKKNEGMDELLKKILKIKTKIEIIKFPNKSSGYFLPTIFWNYNKIERNDLNYSDTKDLFIFKHSGAVENLIFNKKNFKASLDACCYIITFDNRYYYYIGSTTNMKNRFKTHIKNIHDYITCEGNDEKNSLNEFFKYFLDSEIEYALSFLNNDIKIQKKNIINFSMNMLYFSTNYLNEFKRTNPNYKLSKGEWILLYEITNFLIKILEESLIIYFKPKLNSAKNVYFNYIEWNDEFLEIYPKSEKTKEYLKNKKYGFYRPYNEKLISLYENIIKLKMENGQDPYREKEKLNKIKNNEPLHSYTLKDLYEKFNLNKDEILNNINKYHNYSGTNLKNPLKIIEIK